MLHKLVQLGLMEMRMAVLDSIFRVSGVNGLSVSHASVFPKVPGFYCTANIHSQREGYGYNTCRCCITHEAGGERNRHSFINIDIHTLSISMRENSEPIIAIYLELCREVPSSDMSISDSQSHQNLEPQFLKPPFLSLFKRGMSKRDAFPSAMG